MKKSPGSYLNIAAFVCMLLLFIGLGVCIEAKADTATPAAVSLSYKIKFKSESIEVTAPSQIYYAQLKRETDTTVKASELITAARGNVVSGAGTYIIDISTLSASKVNYLGISTTASAGPDGNVTIQKITIPATCKKIEFNINWGEESTAGRPVSGFDYIKDVKITSVNNVTVTYRHNVASGSAAEADISTLTGLQWRKGANCDWKYVADLTASEWESMKTSGAIIYFRVEAQDQTDTKPGERYSKEVKMKMSITRPTAVKVDVSKLNVSIKNGMQFRVTGSDAWYTVLPFQQKSTTVNAIRSVTMAAVFDPYTENTSEKVTALTIERACAVLGVTPTTGSSLSVDVRVAATTKKPASRIGVVIIPPQAAAPSVTFKGETNAKSGVIEYTVQSLLRAASDTEETSKFEYFFCREQDLALLDMTTVKWNSINSNSTIKGTARSSYTAGANGRQNPHLSDPGVVMLVRRAGKAPSAKNTAILASKYVKVTMPAVSGAPSPSPAPSGSPSPSASPSPAPSGTPTGTPDPSGSPTPAPAP